MKKALAILAVALFIGGISVPVIAATNNSMTMITLQDEDPKKNTEGEKSEKKAEESKKATKSGDCSHEANKATKSGDCSHEAKKSTKSSGGCEK